MKKEGMFLSLVDFTLFHNLAKQNLLLDEAAEHKILKQRRKRTEKIQ